MINTKQEIDGIIEGLKCKSTTSHSSGDYVWCEECGDSWEEHNKKYDQALTDIMEIVEREIQKEKNKPTINLINGLKYHYISREEHEDTIRKIRRENYARHAVLSEEHSKALAECRERTIEECIDCVKDIAWASERLINLKSSPLQGEKGSEK